MSERERLNLAPGHEQSDSPESTPTPGGEPRFEDILRQLHEIVQSLEEDSMSLEQSIAAFERGVSLSRHGQQILAAAERRVDVLLRDGTTRPQHEA